MSWVRRYGLGLILVLEVLLLLVVLVLHVLLLMHLHLLLLLVHHHLILLILLELLFLRINLVKVDHFLVRKLPHIFIDEFFGSPLKFTSAVGSDSYAKDWHDDGSPEGSHPVLGVFAELSPDPSAIERTGRHIEHRGPKQVLLVQ